MDINSYHNSYFEISSKNNSKYIMNFPIDIIGEFYKFNDHEINMLMNKGFIISFYSDMMNILNKKIKKMKSL